MESSKVIGNSPAILNFRRLFLKLNCFICNQLPVLPNHRLVEENLSTINVLLKTPKLMSSSSNALLTYFFHHAGCVGNMCEGYMYDSSWPFPTL